MSSAASKTSALPSQKSIVPAIGSSSPRVVVGDAEAGDLSDESSAVHPEVATMAVASAASADLLDLELARRRGDGLLGRDEPQLALA